MAWVITMRDYKLLFKQKREALGLSQHQFAAQLGLTQTFISEIESGRKKPSLDVFFMICEALEIKVFPDEDEEEAP